jgi:hypothetical protein
LGSGTIFSFSSINILSFEGSTDVIVGMLKGAFMMLDEKQTQKLERQGFLVLKGVFAAAEVQDVQALLDPLFERYARLPARHVHHLGGPAAAPGIPAAAEIVRPASLEKRLKSTAVFGRLHHIAAQVFHRPCRPLFDHAIYKSPRTSPATDWHQDLAYVGRDIHFESVNFWVPLQDTPAAAGCMQFIPGSHRGPLLPHRSRHHGPASHALSAIPPDAPAAAACPVRLGDVTAHFPKTLHFTGPNTSGQVRRAWILHFGPGGALRKLMPDYVWARATDWARRRWGMR